jgi:hypothetical protein
MLRRSDVSVDIDNSACLATNNPYHIRNYLRTLGPLAARIKFRGNQAISTGLWDSALPGKHNFWAKISGDSLEVDFPSCEEFENSGCLGLVQREGRGICHDERSNQHVTLHCQQVRRTLTFQNGDSGEQNMDQRQYIWKRSSDPTMTDPRRALEAQAAGYRYY